MYSVSLAIGQHLELNVTRLFEKLLHIDDVVVKRGAGFGLCSGDRGDQ